MTTLANAIVDNGDFEQAETLVEKAATEGLLQEYLRREWWTVPRAVLQLAT